MTLVEVLAGSALLGTLLTGLLVSSARLTSLSVRARQRQEACRAADDLLEGWWPKKEKIPRGQTGEVPNHPGFTWRTTKVRELNVGSTKLDVVAVEVFAPASAGGTDANEPASATVEILLPGSANESTSRPNPG